MAKGDRARTARLAASSSERLEQRLTQAQRRQINATSASSVTKEYRTIGRLENELAQRAIQNSQYASRYEPGGSNGEYRVHVDRDPNNSDRYSYHGTTYTINGRSVETSVYNRGIYSGRAEKGNRSTSKTFDSVAEAVAYVDRQLKRRGVKPR